MSRTRYFVLLIGGMLLAIGGSIVGGHTTDLAGDNHLLKTSYDQTAAMLAVIGPFIVFWWFLLGIPNPSKNIADALAGVGKHLETLKELMDKSEERRGRPINELLKDPTVVRFKISQEHEAEIQALFDASNEKPLDGMRHRALWRRLGEIFPEVDLANEPWVLASVGSDFFVIKRDKVD